MTGLDADALERLFRTALAARDWRDVEAVLHALAVIDPPRAETLIEATRMALKIAERGPGPALVTVTCPVCGSAPSLVISATQAYCGADACRALMWNMTRPADEQLADEHLVRLRRDDEEGTR